MLAFGEDSMLGHEPRGEQPQKDEARKLASAMPFLVQDALMGATRPRAFHAGSFSCRHNPRETFLGRGWGLGELLPDLRPGLSRLARAQEECRVTAGVAGAGRTDSRDGWGCHPGRTLASGRQEENPAMPRAFQSSHGVAVCPIGFVSVQKGGRDRGAMTGALSTPGLRRRDSSGVRKFPTVTQGLQLRALGHSLAEIQAVPFPIPSICHCCLHSLDLVHCPRHFHHNFILFKNMLNDVFFFLPEGKSKEVPRQPHFGGWVVFVFLTQ